MRRLALVFGGSRGIGHACVEALLADGFDVASTATSLTEPADGQAASGGGRWRRYAVDVCDAAAVARVFEDVKRDFGSQVHAVVANAGINVAPAPLTDFPADTFARLCDVNLTGAFNMLAEAARQIQDGGSIVAMGTALVRRPVAGSGPYIATKAAVEALVRSLAIELAPRQVRVNVVAPGPVDTELFRRGKNEAAISRSASMSLFGRVGQAREVADTVAYLLSPRASWITAQVIQPNGGLV